jgi:hypothetical protein
MPAIADDENIHKIAMPATTGAQVLYDELTKADVQ